MSSSKIQRYINLKLKKDKINMTISKSTKYRILKEEYGGPMKIKKIFFLNKKQKKAAHKILQNDFKKTDKGLTNIFIPLKQK